jgi:hypothetical protein
MNTPCGHFDVENDALFGVDRSLLFVGRLDPRQTTALSERGVRIRLADPLRFAGRSTSGDGAGVLSSSVKTASA